MATTIKLKNGSGAPAASDLVQGEPALDLTNKRLYSEDSGGTVIEIGTNPSTLSIAGTAVTATAAELNILDGVTATTAELNILDGVTATFGEINLLDGSSAGTIVNSKSVIYGAAGEVNATTLQIGGVSITSTAAELNILDGVTATTAELNILDGVTSTAAELNVLDGVTAFVDEDDMSSDSATSIPSQQSVKAYVDSQTGGVSSTLSGLSDTNVTSPADAALLFYDTGTSKWIDNVVSGDITIADTGVAAIGAGVIVNADVNASAAIDVSKTALTAGTGLTLTTNTLSVDASQTQITAVGTIATGTWQGTAIADAYVANDLTISGGTVDNSVIGGTTAAAGTFTNLTASGTLTLGGVAVTSTAAEINLLDGSTADTVVNSKAVIYGSAGQITANELDVDNIQIDANAVKSTDTNGNIQLFPNGTGFTELYGNTNAGKIRFNCESNSHGVTLQGPPHSAAATYTLELPNADGTSGQALVTDGSGKLSFSDAGINTGKAIAMAIVFG